MGMVQKHNQGHMSIKKWFFIFLVAAAPLGVFGATDVKNDPSLSNGLTSYWELEESSGTRFDSVGSNDLTDNNTVSQSTDCKQGNCADFEDTNSEYLSITDALQTGLLDNDEDNAISLWINFESGTGDDDIISKYAAAGYAYQLGRKNGTNLLRVGWANNADCNTPVAKDISWNANTDQWYHIVVNRDDDAGESVVYIDGQKQSTSTLQETGNLCNSNAQFNIGASGNGAFNYIDGRVDEVGYWERQLTASEVADLYNNGDGIPYDAGGGGQATSTELQSVFVTKGDPQDYILISTECSGETTTTCTYFYATTTKGINTEQIFELFITFAVALGGTTLIARELL